MGKHSTDARPQSRATLRTARAHTPLTPWWRALPSPFGWALIMAGTAAGALLRWMLPAVIPVGGWVHGPTLVANTVGSGLLAALIHLATRSPGATYLQDLRLLLGTGLCAGLTTYSSFALEVWRTAMSSIGAAVGYSALTFAAGGVAAALGWYVGGERA